jgi:hypothetical protein
MLQFSVTDRKNEDARGVRDICAMNKYEADEGTGCGGWRRQDDVGGQEAGRDDYEEEEGQRQIRTEHGDGCCSHFSLRLQKNAVGGGYIFTSFGIAAAGAAQHAKRQTESKSASCKSCAVLELFLSLLASFRGHHKASYTFI